MIVINVQCGVCQRITRLIVEDNRGDYQNGHHYCSNGSCGATIADVRGAEVNLKNGSINTGGNTNR